MSLKFPSIAFVLLVSTLFYAASSTPAQAYLDPGTASMLLQVVLGGVAGVALAGRFYWQKFLAVVGMKRPAAPTEAPSDQAAGPSKSQAE